MPVTTRITDAAFAMGPEPSGLAGRLLGDNYKVLHILDEGGMGIVAVAEHVRLRRQVAVKLLPARLSANPQAHARFRREAEILAGIDHPHVVQVLDYDVTLLGEPFLVMELLHGESFAARLARDVVVSLDETVRIIGEIAAGLTAAHAAGTVHRDLKPANVFLVDALGTRPFVKLLDFGVSRSAHESTRLTGEHMVLGTPDYMAPEQARGQSHEASPRADQYSLAVIAFEMLAGRPPFVGIDLGRLIDDIVHAEAPRLSAVAPWVCAELDAVIEQALHKDPNRRFPSVAAFAEAFAGAIDRARGGLSAVPTRRSTGSTIVSDHGGEARGNEGSSLVPGTRCMVEELDAARQALALGEPPLAMRHAEEALRIARESGDTAAELILSVSASLLERVFAARVGPWDVRLSHARRRSGNGALSPQLAYLLSRIEDGMTVEEVIGSSGLRTTDAVRLLAHLMDHGWVEPAPFTKGLAAIGE